MPSNSSFVCVLFGPMTSTKWWNIEVTGLASESIARHHGYGMMSNDEVLGFAVFESGKDWWRPCCDSSCLPKEYSMGHNGSTEEFFVRYPDKIVFV